MNALKTRGTATSAIKMIDISKSSSALFLSKPNLWAIPAAANETGIMDRDNTRKLFMNSIATK
jgi:hypothetical protein